MRQIIFSLFAITLAAIAAMAATTFVINTPVRTGPPVGVNAAAVNSPQAPPATPGDKPAPPGEPGTPAPAPQGGTPGESAPPAAPGTAAPEGEEEADKDPYEGLSPEEVPPDLQYSADSSVSFPTNI
jgi:hypothetical protein